MSSKTSRMLKALKRGLLFASLLTVWFVIIGALVYALVNLILLAPSIIPIAFACVALFKTLLAYEELED